MLNMIPMYKSIISNKKLNEEFFQLSFFSDCYLFKWSYNSAIDGGQIFFIISDDSN